MSVVLQGNVANFVETEQLVEVEGPKGAAVSSYVQVCTIYCVMQCRI